VSVIPVKTGVQVPRTARGSFAETCMIDGASPGTYSASRWPSQPSARTSRGESNLLHPVSNRLHSLMLWVGERVCVAKFFRGNSMT
jgi:hypothetical protein